MIRNGWATPLLRSSPALSFACFPLAGISPELSRRQSPYAERAAKQAPLLKLPKFPTTTIGSFPQTAEIRLARSRFRAGNTDHSTDREVMRTEIAPCVREQEKLGLDVLVHDEAERHDMVEYVGEQFEGYVLSQCGWVQAYGSRCVKPPILFGDISRLRAMTVEWITYAQSLTDKPMKGMLTGPVTILNRSFVRDDQPRSVSCRQLALAIREEVLDLEKAGVRVLQIDETALREGLPLRKSRWQDHLDWAVEAFRISVSGVADETQIHTHMCYSEFNDIIASIADIDADVITTETFRSDMELLDAFDDFDDFKYPNAIGPDGYDIHSPQHSRRGTHRYIAEESRRADSRRTPVDQSRLRLEDPPLGSSDSGADQYGRRGKNVTRRKALRFRKAWGAALLCPTPGPALLPPPPIGPARPCPRQIPGAAN